MGHSIQDLFLNKKLFWIFILQPKTSAKHGLDYMSRKYAQAVMLLSKKRKHSLQRLRNTIGVNSTEEQSQRI